MVFLTHYDVCSVKLRKRGILSANTVTTEAGMGFYGRTRGFYGRNAGFKQQKCGWQLQKWGDQSIKVKAQGTAIFIFNSLWVPMLNRVEMFKPFLGWPRRMKHVRRSFTRTRTGKLEHPVVPHAWICVEFKVVSHWFIHVKPRIHP